MTNEERCDIALQAKEPERPPRPCPRPRQGRAEPGRTVRPSGNSSRQIAGTEGGRGSGRRGSQRHGRADGMVSPRRPPAVRRRLPRPPPGGAPETKYARPSSPCTSRRRWSLAPTGPHRQTFSLSFGLPRRPLGVVHSASSHCRNAEAPHVDPSTRRRNPSSLSHGAISRRSGPGWRNGASPDSGLRRNDLRCANPRAIWHGSLPISAGNPAAAC